MNKNLKKVISSVIALALSVGSAAIAAPSFSDVPETASYAQAVNTLASLGVISGYAEDGTFKPDNNITRAEVTTMIVAALNRSADAEGSKGTTKFADVNVPAKEWASGYVNIGTSEGFIKGYEDGSFQPDNNVTYAELCVMLVSIAGYGDYASYLGGWPNGYLSVASDKGISKGVSGSADTAVTRGQVAQMIYNTLLDVPLTRSTTLTVDKNGNYVPELETMDGKNDRDYETLLTNKHNAYYVEGYVSATNRTEPTLDADEVDFTIEYTENYDDMDTVVKKGDTVAKETVYVGDTKAADYLFTYASAIIQIDDNDDAIIKSFIPSGRNTVSEFNANLIDDDDYKTIVDNNGNSVFDKDGKVKKDAFVRYYADKASSRSTKYNLDQGFELYVNGVKTTLNQANFEKYVVNNEVGTVQYIDRYSALKKTDGKYDIVFATYYATAQIGSVNATSGRIVFDSAYNTNRVNSITLDPEDEDLAVDIYYNGEKIELSALQTDDIISIAYDVEYDLDKSTFYEIHVSRDTATGKFTRENPEDETVTIGGKEYEFVMGYNEGKDTINMADEYTLYLDAYGRIFSTEILASSAKLAVVDRYTKNSADDYHRALLYATDGTAKSIEVDTTRVSLEIGGQKYTGSDVDDQMLKLVYKNGKDGEKTDIQNRVVEYKISSASGRIISLEIAEAQRSAKDQSYKASSKSLGGLKLNDATVVIDAIEYVGEKTPTYSDLSLSSVTGLVDDNEYTAFAYGTRNTDGTYPLVIVTDAGGNYTYETNFAVLTKTPGQGYDDETGDEIYTLEALYQKEEYDNTNPLIVNDDAVINGATNITDLRKGDVIVFVKDGKGNIKQIDVLAKASTLGVGDNGSYDEVFKNLAKKTDTGLFTIPAGANNYTAQWFKNKYESNINISREVSNIVCGPVVDKTATYFTLGNIASTTDSEGKDTPIEVETSEIKDGKPVTKNYKGLYTNLVAGEVEGGTLEVDIDNNTNVYVYDYSKSNEKVRLTTGSNADIIAASIAKASLYNNGDFIPWSELSAADGVAFAFAKIVDGTATDVYVIIK